jgi:hypothetical protein
MVHNNVLMVIVMVHSFEAGTTITLLYIAMIHLHSMNATGPVQFTVLAFQIVFFFHLGWSLIIDSQMFVNTLLRANVLFSSSWCICRRSTMTFILPKMT